MLYKAWKFFCNVVFGVQVSGDVSLPQFKVLGHRQKTIEASLSTGKIQEVEFPVKLNPGPVDLAFQNWQH